MPDPSKSSFPSQFRRHVQPQLAAAIPIEAWLIAADIQSWEDGYRHLIDLAMSRGAGHLPDDVWYDLRDWLSGELVAAITLAEPGVAGRREALDPVFQDIERCEIIAARGADNVL